MAASTLIVLDGARTQSYLRGDGAATSGDPFIPSHQLDATLNTGATKLMKLEDAASVSGDAGVMALAIRQATPAVTSGTDGDYEPLQTSNGKLWTKRSSVAITPTITVSTSPAYTSGDGVGGKITITNAVRVSGGTARLESLQVIDTSNQKPAMTLLIFNADPTAATTTDNAAFAFSTDITKLVGQYPIATADFVTINSIAIANYKGIGMVLQGNATANLYAALVTTSTPTFAATTAISLVFGLVQED